MNQESTDRVLAAATACAHAALADLIRTDQPPRPAYAQAEGAGWRVSVRVEAVGPGDLWRNLTECERDVVEVLASCPHRCTGSWVRKELARQGRHHGDSTVNRALAHLHRVGLLGSSRRAPRGYWLLVSAGAAERVR